MDIGSAPGLADGLEGLAVAFVVALGLVPLGIKLAWRLGVVDRPAGLKIHQRTTPLMGGVAVASAFLITTLVFAAIKGFLFEAGGPNAGLIGLLAGCALAALLGLADEVWTLKPHWHFAGQVAVVLVALAAGFPRITKLGNPLASPSSVAAQGNHYLAFLVGLGDSDVGFAHVVTLALGIAFTVFWIVGMMNTVNFLDGLDGLAGGVCAIAALFLGLWAVTMANTPMAGKASFHNQNVILALVLCGAILGFLVFNWAPARVFMGDSGAMFMGFAVGALSIFGQVKLGTALLILIVPIVDVAWAIVRRLSGRRSFAQGDKHHIYHRMLELGMGRRSVVLAFYALCIALGVIDLNLYKKQKLLADAVVAVLAAACAVGLELRGRRAGAREGAARADASPGSHP